MTPKPPKIAVPDRQVRASSGRSILGRASPAHPRRAQDVDLPGLGHEDLSATEHGLDPEVRPGRVECRVAQVDHTTSVPAFDRSTAKARGRAPERIGSKMA
jgi:hypothetical protein